MLAFLRDYIIYLWNVLFKQTQPASVALTSTDEGNKGSSSCASTTFPIASADKKDKVEESKPSETPTVPTSPREKVEEPKPDPPKVTTRVEVPRPEAPPAPAAPQNRAAEPKPEPPKLPPSPPPADVGKVDSISSPPPKPSAPTQPSVKPADLFYPSTHQDKRIPPEPSRPAPSLSEPKIVCNAVPPLAATKPVVPPPSFEAKATPATSPASETVPSSRPSPAKSIPHRESDEVQIKPALVQPPPPPPPAVAHPSPRVDEVPLKPKIVQEVKREVVPASPIETKDLDDEDEYEYEEEEVEEEDIEDYEDQSATPDTKPQQVRAPPKVEEYDSEDDLITDIDRLDDHVIESK